MIHIVAICGIISLTFHHRNVCGVAITEGYFRKVGGKIRNQLAAAAVGLCLAVVFIFLSAWVIRPNGLSLSGHWKDPFDQMVPIPSLSFTSDFSGTQHSVILFSLPANERWEVLLNNQKMGQDRFRFLPKLTFFGNPFGYLFLSPELLQEHNTLLIIFPDRSEPIEPFFEMYGLTLEQYTRFDTLFKTLNLYYRFVTIGATFLLALILISLGWSAEIIKKKAYLLMGFGIMIAFLTILPLTFDYLVHASQGVDLLNLNNLFLQFLGTLLGNVMLLKAVGLLFFSPPRFSHRGLWLVPLVSTILFLEPIIPLSSLVHVGNFVNAGLLLLLAISYIRMKSKMTIVLFFMIGCLTLSLAVLPLSFQFASLIPFLRNHGLFSLILFQGILLVKDYKKLMQEKTFFLDQSTRDGLTGLFNHAVFKSVLDMHFDRFIHNGQTASLIMFDIDNFKTINDQFGHLAGDDVLRSVSTLLREMVRETDSIGRYGGDEFAILLQHTTSHQARDVAEKIRRKVSKLTFHAGDRSFSPKISLGVSAISPTFESASDWIHAADKAMYASKKAGKNRVSVWTTDHP